VAMVDDRNKLIEVRDYDELLAGRTTPLLINSAAV
jgi:hypothetical protein